MLHVDLLFFKYHVWSIFWPPPPPPPPFLNTLTSIHLTQKCSQPLNIYQLCISFNSVLLSYFCRFNMSTGLVWANGEHWKKVRRFALHSMRDLGVGKKSIEEVIQDEAKTLTNIFASKENQPITDVKRMMTTSISNVIHHVVFGFRYVCKVKQLKWKSINLQYLQLTCIWGSE